MDEHQERILKLIEKYERGESTPAELQELDAWYLSFEQEEDMTTGFSPEQEQALKHLHLSRLNVNLDRELQRIMIKPVKRTSFMWPRIAVAASLLITISVSTYLVLRKQPRVETQSVAVQRIDIAPGNQGATLQLSNGQLISLNSARVGNIAQQGNANITKTADNKIIYNVTAPASESVYNTITTKRGNFYPLTLSDGTVAILDAASSIKYPVAFTGNERKVEITGQVYFEVKHNAKMPFRVVANGQTFEDLGTSFNINAYNDEPDVKATLIEGSIKVNDQNILIPGQQAIITDGHIKVGKADIEQAIAWKNGSFNFDNTPMDVAMRQISRWYDVEIEYPNGTPKTVFNGGMYRNMKASQVLEILSFFKVHFEIVQGSDGKKILVKP